VKRRACRHPKWARLVDRSRETCSLCEAWRERCDGWVVEWVHVDPVALEQVARSAVAYEATR